MSRLSHQVCGGRSLAAGLAWVLVGCLATASAHAQAAGEADASTYAVSEPALPEGMTLDEVLSRANQPPPERFPVVIHDNRLLAFLLADQLEYRADGKSTPDVLGWEADFWLGGDYNRLWVKPEGEAALLGDRSVESETDVLYSRLILPFWSAQLGVQYANEWASASDYEDRWSAVVAIQGLAPGKFEVDASLYVSENAKFSAATELEYDWRLLQRLVLQPRAELGFAFQNIPGADLRRSGSAFRVFVRDRGAPLCGARCKRNGL